VVPRPRARRLRARRPADPHRRRHPRLQGTALDLRQCDQQRQRPLLRSGAEGNDRYAPGARARPGRNVRHDPPDLRLSGDPDRAPRHPGGVARAADHHDADPGLRPRHDATQLRLAPGPVFPPAGAQARHRRHGVPGRRETERHAEVGRDQAQGNAGHLRPAGDQLRAGRAGVDTRRRRRRARSPCSGRSRRPTSRWPLDDASADLAALEADAGFRDGGGGRARRRARLHHDGGSVRRRYAEARPRRMVRHGDGGREHHRQDSTPISRWRTACASTGSPSAWARSGTTRSSASMRSTPAPARSRSGAAARTPSRCPHAAGSRLWFYEVGFAFDSTEFTDAETVNVKLLSNTGSQQLSAGVATALPLTFDQRQARPYPPGNVQVAAALGRRRSGSIRCDLGASRSRTAGRPAGRHDRREHRSREAPSAMAFVSRTRRTAALIVERTDLGGPDATVQLGASAPASVRMKLWAISDNGASWQTHEHVFTFSGGSGAPSIDGVDYIPPPGDVIVDGNDPPPSSSGSGHRLARAARAPGYAADADDRHDGHRSVRQPLQREPECIGGGQFHRLQFGVRGAASGGGIVRPSAAGTYQSTPRTRSRRSRRIPNWTSDAPGASEGRVFVDGDLAVGAPDADSRFPACTTCRSRGWLLTGYRDEWATNGGVAVHGKSEWAHGIGVGDSTDVNLINISADKFVADAISIGRLAATSTSATSRRRTTAARASATAATTRRSRTSTSATSAAATAPRRWPASTTRSTTRRSTHRQHGDRRGRIHHCSGPGISSTRIATTPPSRTSSANTT
jgi:hypothetical protein